MAAARGFRFEPGRYGGKPVPVEITFTHTFLPRADRRHRRARPPETPAGPPLTSVLRGRLVQLGTRAPVAARTVTAVVGDQRYRPRPTPRGHFRLPLPPGAARVTVIAPGTTSSSSRRRSRPKQELAVTYYVERDRYDPYEIVVVGEQRREEVSRITLRGAEIKQIPGTFGDPFRVVQTLPGVASVGVAAAVPDRARREPELDRASCSTARACRCSITCCPGPASSTRSSSTRSSSIPGGAPVPYGGYTGGIIDGRTRRARRDERLLDFDANLLQAGGFVRAADRAARRDRDGRRALRLPGLPARPRDQRGVAVVLGLPAAARRRHAAQRLDGLRVRRARPARHAGARRRSQRSEPAARAVADPRLSPPRPAPATARRDDCSRRTAPCSATTGR